MPGSGSPGEASYGPGHLLSGRVVVAMKNLDRRIEIRASIEQVRIIDERAREAGMDRSDYCRSLALGALKPMESQTSTASDGKDGFPDAPIRGGAQKRVVFRLTAAQLSVIDERAALSGLSRADFVRLAALGQPPADVVRVPGVNQLVYVELGRIGCLLNQYLRHLNRGVASPVPRNCWAT